MSLRQQDFRVRRCWKTRLKFRLERMVWQKDRRGVSSRPMPFSERGSRRKRVWEQIRSRLGAETVASRPVCAERHRPLTEREWFHLCHLPFSGICQPCVSEKQESGKSAVERMAADLPDSFYISGMPWMNYLNRSDISSASAAASFRSGILSLASVTWIWCTSVSLLVASCK